MLFQTMLPLAAAGFDKEVPLNVFEIVLVGFSFVFLILLALSLMTSILGRAFARLSFKESSGVVDANEAMAVASKQLPVSSKAAESGFSIKENDPHLVAVVAAAIHCVMEGREYKIISIRSREAK